MLQTIDVTREGTRRSLDAATALSYHIAGEGETLVMLHGSGPGVSGWGNFGANLPLFSQHFQTVIPDQPGFGLSPRPEMDRPYHRISSDAIVALLDDLDVEKAHVLGNSMGGSVAARFALDHPDRLAKLVLMGPGGVGAGILAPSPSEGLSRLVEFAHDPTRERLIVWMKTMVSDKAFITEELIEERWRNAWSQCYRVASTLLFPRGRQEQAPHRGDPAVGSGAPDRCADPDHLGSRRPSDPAGDGLASAAPDARGGAPCLLRLRSLGDDGET